MGKRKIEINYEKRYTKRFRRSKSSTREKSKLREDSISRLNKKDKGYYSCRLSQPTRWTCKKRKEDRRSDSGFDTKSVKSPGTRVRKRSVERDIGGHLKFEKDQILRLRYKLCRILGQGTFGKVVLAEDMKNNNERVAIKIVRKDKFDYEDAILEIKILKNLEKHSIKTNISNPCIEVKDWFDYHGHICIVFQMLGHSIYEFMKRNNFQPFKMNDVEKISFNLCKAVKYIHNLKLAHTDLKPENILFVHSNFSFLTDGAVFKRGAYRQIGNCQLKLIDFGSAVYEEDHKKGLVTTRHYRAPEVILEKEWTYPCDIWSLGCILFELYVGKTLFQTHNTLEHLAMMERVLGKIPESMKSSKYFKNGKLRESSKTRGGTLVHKNCRLLVSYMKKENKKEELLFDLISKMLIYDPSKRITIDQALNHEFFHE